MLSKIKLWFFNHKNFLRMSRFLILTVSLLLVTWIFDYQYIAIKSYIPKQLLLSVEVSVDFLSNISGIFLTISTFCFTIIVTVLNKYSSSISPRMLRVSPIFYLILFVVFLLCFHLIVRLQMCVRFPINLSKNPNRERTILSPISILFV